MLFLFYHNKPHFVTSQSILNRLGSCSNWVPIGIYNDDVGWWSIASLEAYAETGEIQYEDCSRAIFDGVYQNWDPIGGGIWWNSSHAQKNTVTNALAAITASYLSELLSDPSYRDKATTIYNWMLTHLTQGFNDPIYNNKVNAVYDNIDSNGVLNTAQITYNYGLFIGAALSISSASYTTSTPIVINSNFGTFGTILPTVQLFLSHTIDIANASFNKIMTNGSKYIQVEANISSASNAAGNDQFAIFKGVYTRYLANLAYMANVPNTPVLSQILQINASAAWSNRNPDNLVGGQWMNPTPPESSTPILSWEDQPVVAMLQAATENSSQAIVSNF